jgi:D-alanyl-D-alanine carboxypeptidase/D-alanyl-D-alanine-endopeptidase (penicillin-binding protein 4)
LPGFQRRLRKILSAPGVNKGYWGVFVADGRRGKALFSLNADRYFTPASNTKLFTTALALAELGPDYRFRTTLESPGSLAADGKLTEDLVLVGRGDPNLSGRRLPYDATVVRDAPAERVLAELADAAVARGLREIGGDVVADDSYFADGRYPPGWSIRDMLYEYGAPVTALAVDDNVFLVAVRPGTRAGDVAAIEVQPPAEIYEFASEVVTGLPGSARDVEVLREPGSRKFTLRGSLPAGSHIEALTLAIEEPVEYAAALLKSLLEARGVRVSGGARARHAASAVAAAVSGGPETISTGALGTMAGSVSAPMTVLAEHTSLPLIETVRVINKSSQNLHAEMLLRTVAVEKTGKGTTRAGLTLEKEFLEKIGVEPNDVVLQDGSGLSRRNLVTPRAVVGLLVWAERQPWGNAFAQTLPVAGDDGTLAERMKDVPAAGRVHAKTGTLGGVNALSGYAESLSGRHLVFSFFGNLHNLEGTQATEVLDALAAAMVSDVRAGKKPAASRTPR